ncbi:hypothetical protein M7I_5170 [Glarea lozoyensis 74030]|uniref:2EXR domain-containing protein n=1 Tax=Glarea lozoyensis (strain ATCC 74030 / MF5533) TaxID=1104152 RepID=H0ER54_GLAL7|nr:hypothetical protein M7I_5170 [Glarea lozoyensis 74030]
MDTTPAQTSNESATATTDELAILNPFETTKTYPARVVMIDNTQAQTSNESATVTTDELAITNPLDKTKTNPGHKIPLEIQTMIWNYLVDSIGPRRVSVWPKSNRNKIPVVFHVNHESRTTALKTYARFTFTNIREPGSRSFDFFFRLDLDNLLIHLSPEALDYYAALPNEKDRYEMNLRKLLGRAMRRRRELWEQKQLDILVDVLAAADSEDDVDDQDEQDLSDRNGIDEYHGEQHFLSE